MSSFSYCSIITYDAFQYHPIKEKGIYEKSIFFILSALLFFSVYRLPSQSIQFGSINDWNKFPYKTVNFDNGNYRLIWSIQGDTIYMGISAGTKGWIAIGLKP